MGPYAAQPISTCLNGVMPSVDIEAVLLSAADAKLLGAPQSTPDCEGRGGIDEEGANGRANVVGDGELGREKNATKPSITKNTLAMAKIVDLPRLVTSK
jgi:hypothetical protein